MSKKSDNIHDLLDVILVYIEKPILQNINTNITLKVDTEKKTFTYLFVHKSDDNSSEYFKRTLIFIIYNWIASVFTDIDKLTLSYYPLYNYSIYKLDRKWQPIFYHNIIDKISKHNRTDNIHNIHFNTSSQQHLTMDSLDRYICDIIHDNIMIQNTSKNWQIKYMANDTEIVFIDYMFFKKCTIYLFLTYTKKEKYIKCKVYGDNSLEHNNGMCSGIIINNVPKSEIKKCYANWLDGSIYKAMINMIPSESLDNNINNFYSSDFLDKLISKDIQLII
jgi:hypothetical protein